MSNFYRLDVTALRQLLSERATDWTVPFATLIQAAVRVTSRHVEEWKKECDLITEHKHQIAVFNGKNYGRKEKMK